MSNDIAVKRERIKATYSGSLTWSDKVDQMSDAQVLAVHRRLTAEGMIK